MDSTSITLKFKELAEKFSVAKSDIGFIFSFNVSDENLTFLKDCINLGFPPTSFLIDDLYLEYEQLESHGDQAVIAEIAADELRKLGVYIYWDWSNLIEYRPNILSPPTNFLILQDCSIYPSDNPSVSLKHYLDVCIIINLLVSNADHTMHLTENIAEEVIFLHKSRLEIPISYSSESLGEGLDGVSVVNALFHDTSHAEQKKSILKEVTYSLLANIPKADRLQYLLMNFGEFSKRLNENYQLFVSEFSFDEVRKEYEESKRGYFTKLNDVFSSVQTKMLGIPISLALASLKMSAIVNDISFWTNFLLVLSISIYGIMMFMLITNQKHTLKAIKVEYDSQMARLKHQYADQYDKIKGIQVELDSRYSFQNTCLNWFYVMSACLFFLVLALFFWNLPWKIILGVS